MNRRDWQALEEAAHVLQLGEKASLAEIKRAYHRLSKIYHPDVAPVGDKAGNQEKMHQITDAYELLMAYCHDYAFPVRQEVQVDVYDPEEWWRNRFGEDLFWGTERQKKKKK